VPCIGEEHSGHGTLFGFLFIVFLPLAVIGIVVFAIYSGRYSSAKSSNDPKARFYGIVRLAGLVLFIVWIFFTVMVLFYPSIAAVGAPQCVNSIQ
jgi:heme/copper-type cytochrome/quinol oxidase subunit 2